MRRWCVILIVLYWFWGFHIGVAMHGWSPQPAKIFMAEIQVCHQLFFEWSVWSFFLLSANHQHWVCDRKPMWSISGPRTDLSVCIWDIAQIFLLSIRGSLRLCSTHIREKQAVMLLGNHKRGITQTGLEEVTLWWALWGLLFQLL